MPLIMKIASKIFHLKGIALHDPYRFVPNLYILIFAVQTIMIICFFLYISQPSKPNKMKMQVSSIQLFLIVSTYFALLLVLLPGLQTIKEAFKLCSIENTPQFVSFIHILYFEDCYIII